MLKYRKKLINRLFEITMMVYCKFKKKKAWGISTEMLLEMPQNTFGHYLGNFLKKHGFNLIPKVERHDAYHVLMGYGTSVEDEIALQYCCFGNGKRTPYLYGVLFLGTLLLPEYSEYYVASYHLGKRINTFHHYDFKTVLPLDFYDFKSIIFSSNTFQKPLLKNLNYEK